MDGYWAKDIQELFRLERRASFQRFVELLLAQSGGIFEATKFAGPCEVSRTTIVNYLAALEATSVVLVLRPFSSRRSNEIIAAPKVYGFDPASLLAFARAYPKVELFVVTTDAKPAFAREYRGKQVRFVTLERIVRQLMA